MSQKGYTVIMLPPEGQTRVRRFKLHPFVLVWMSCLALTVVSACTYFGIDYYRLKSSLPDINRLKKENISQRAQILGFTEKLAEFQQEMEKLSQFNHKLKVVLGLESAEKNDFQGQGGSYTEESKPISVIARQLERQMKIARVELARLSSEAKLSERTQQELQSFIESRKSVLAATPSIWPARGYITSHYGWRKSPFTGKREFHRGLDVANRLGSYIHSPSDGIVASVTRKRGYGRIVMINHGYGLVTKYAHLRRAIVKPGQLVKRGQKIAIMGNTGRSTGPHLHYEVVLNSKTVNPINYILD